MSKSNKPRDAHETVKDAYGRIAREQSGGCCGGSSCCGDKGAYVVADHPVPEAELGVSCGNPVAFSHLRPGDIVLDLGSGAGKDVFLAAQAVGAAGRAIGVDMTPDMLALAARNAEKFTKRTGLSNVEFRRGQIEDLPVEACSVDAVISNCVINLSPDKPRVFREVHRVLKAAGRMIVSDIVLNRPLPEAILAREDLYSACLTGALPRQEYLDAIAAAGFATVEVLDEHVYAVTGSCCGDKDCETMAALEGAASSITVLAVKR